ncbi:hypothetical protein HMJ29_10395 [Hymenobacter taeanensis]|uniref:Uncharacterized protein n=1 Tax=Hymenobacter taeanensis TaxID=2735321 RepID=A0A6M6BJT1_9BACT|nr:MULTISPECIES: hypothetical protein [Hymenobacter]QJX47325.1 hypothetical protein HMJ29_10395 [Hymenobacter taeanensis]UOQ79338.1 hypothetical protein MUN83_10735 [Hymenobacter sp. 5414T-23]
MIKPLLISGLVCLFAGAALAQSPTTNLPSETFKQRLRAQYLQNDTAQAIINLYSTRQGGGAGWLTASALSAGRAAASGAGGGTVALVPFVAYGVSKLVRFSNKNLEQTLTAYAAGQPLPRSTRRRLKSRFFAQPIIQYTPVQATPAK